MKPPLAPRQRALPFNLNQLHCVLNIFKASAGSGKTFTLAKEYITMLLAIKDAGKDSYALNLDITRSHLLFSQPHRAILAITFTRKATEEMKRRIIKELALLARVPTNGEKESLYAKEMMERFLFRGAHCARADLAITAKLALQQLLFDYQNFNISTIDAFFQRVMHTFARELGQQSDYAIELDPEAAMRNAVGIMLDEFNTQPQGNQALETWLLDFMRKQIDQGKRANFFNRRSGTHTSLVKLISNITLESFKPFEADTMAYLKDENGHNHLDQFSRALAARQQEIIDDLKAQAQSFTAQGTIEAMPTNSAFRKGLELLAEGKLWTDIDSAFKSVFGQSILTGQITGKVGSKKISEEDEIAIKDFFRPVYEEYANVQLLQDIADCLSQLGLLKHAWSYLDDFNRDNNTVLLAQTNSLVSQIIDGSNSPFVYERMGVKLRHFLIDEFQDTSALQWQNLWPLVLNSVSSGDDNLVIGDEKQSIYRWRNSDSEILHTGIQEQMAQARQKCTVLGGRTTNYRSSHAIVKFNNTLFSHLAKANSIPGFDQVIQKTNPSLASLPGYVRFTSIDHIKAQLKAQAAEGDSQGVEANDIVLQQMADEILRQHKSGYQWRDIAVLTRSNKDAALVVDYLAKNHPEINVLSEEALKVGSSNAVQLVLNTLRIIDQQATAETQKAEAESKIPSSPESPQKPKYPSKAEIMLDIHRFGLSLNRLFEEARANGSQLSTQDMSVLTLKALDLALDKENADVIVDDLTKIRSKKPTSLVAMVETIIGNQFSAEERKRQFTYLTAFQDLVIDFCAQNQGSVHAFLDWWAIKGCNKNVSGAADSNAVQVLTVHKAKGLEWPCVLIPFCTWKLYGSKNSTLWTAFPTIGGLEENTPPALYVTLKDAYKDEAHPFGMDYNQEHEKLKIDTANMTYVAFTRAINELIVWHGGDSSSSKKDGEEVYNPSISQLLNAAFAYPQVDVQAEPDLLIDLSEYFCDATFTFGAPTSKIDKSASVDSDQIPQHHLELEDPYPVFFPTHASSLLALNDVLDDFKDIDDDPSQDKTLHDEPPRPSRHAKTPEQLQRELEAKRYGDIMHDIMGHIISREDYPHAIEFGNRRWRLADTLSEYSEPIEKFLALDDERISRWFAPDNQVYVEQPIFSPMFSEMHRPDRIVVYPDNSADVIDYKFTRNVKLLERPEYQTQVLGYMGLLREMGYGPVRGYLCAPLIPKIKEVK